MKKIIFNLMIITALIATSCKGGKQSEDKDQIKQEEYNSYGNNIGIQPGQSSLKSLCSTLKHQQVQSA